MNEPFNSQAPHFLTKVKAYCAKVLPLVFDNSLSYYEFLGKMCHKLNECIDALNSQNLNIIEFTHMVQLEIENFEKYIDSRMTEYENALKTEWAQFKEEINTAFNDFKTQIESEWQAEKALNEKFRTDLLAEFAELKADITAQQENFENQIKADFNTFKETINAEVEQFEQTTNTDLTAFKNTMQTQQNEFENHMVELFNNFKTTEKQARTDFESNFQQLFEQWKIDTLAALNQNITDWETEKQTELTQLIDEKYIVFNTTLSGEVTKLQNSINNEANERQAQDENLQNQINQLTPEGSIKADNADSYGNSQLYTVNPDTHARTNIYPTPDINIVRSDAPLDDNVSQLYRYNTITGDRTNIFPKSDLSTIYLAPNDDETLAKLSSYRYGAGFILFFTSKEGRQIIGTGVTDLGSELIKIHKSKLYLDNFAGYKAIDVLNRIQFNFTLLADKTNITAIGLTPPINFMIYNPKINGDYFSCGVLAINPTNDKPSNYCWLLVNANLINN